MVVQLSCDIDVAVCAVSYAAGKLLTPIIYRILFARQAEQSIDGAVHSVRGAASPLGKVAAY